ncbi:hypothetical protein O9K51_06002 [Purpureocillium lavendulum]|uniref:Uncharacterized protein n=1 Tax=Purpureocillium lavendulum TaxID=1247861 RepID=A0AB34FUF0_9HYPO|nr:hypothetical protein O9K51_06002 [Purpureocillium lavendulum]
MPRRSDMKTRSQGEDRLNPKQSGKTLPKDHVAEGNSSGPSGYPPGYPHPGKNKYYSFLGYGSKPMPVRKYVKLALGHALPMHEMVSLVMKHGPMHHFRFFHLWCKEDQDEWMSQWFIIKTSMRHYDMKLVRLDAGIEPKPPEIVFPKNRPRARFTALDAAGTLERLLGHCDREKKTPKAGNNKHRGDGSDSQKRISGRDPGGHSRDGLARDKGPRRHQNKTAPRRPNTQRRDLSRSKHKHHSKHTIKKPVPTTGAIKEHPQKNKSHDKDIRKNSPPGAGTPCQSTAKHEKVTTLPPQSQPRKDDEFVTTELPAQKQPWNFDNLSID